MKYDFDEVIDRSVTDSRKWRNLEKKSGHSDILPMWVADMDFKTCPNIIEGFKKQLELGIFGYYEIEDEVFESIINWFYKRHGVMIKKEWIIFIPGVVAGFNLTLASNLEKGEKIIVQPPIYPRFLDLDKNNDIEIINNPLIRDGNDFYIDFESLEKSIDKKTKAIMFCNPHNPTGRVWSGSELNRLGEIAQKHNLIILSDDIHSDIIRVDKKYIPVIKDENLLDRTVTFIAPSKTFNLGGLSTAIAIVPNQKIKKNIIDRMEKLHMPLTNIFGKEAIRIAFEEGEQWLEDLKKYIDGNIEYAKKYIDENIKSINAYIPEGTYLMWLDFSQFQMSNKEINNILLSKGKLWLNDGAEYGINGESNFRLNTACTRVTLKEGLSRLKKAVDYLNTKQED